MQISFPIGYDVIGKRPGKRTFRPLRMAERATAEISEVSSTDAPVAVEWFVDPTHLRTRPMTATTCFAGDERGCAFTRWYEGRHWFRLMERNINSCDYMVHARELSAGRLEEFLMAGDAHIAVGLSGCMIRDAKLPKKDGDLTLEFEALRKSGREEAFRTAEALSSNLIIVDGVVHVACAQPAPARTMVREYRDGNAPSLYNVSMRTDHIALDGYDPSLSKVLAFGIEDWDRLSALRVDGVVLPPPTIHVDDSVDTDVEAHRGVGNLVKLALARWGCPALARDDFTRFLNDASKQRYWRLEEILAQAGPSFLPPLEQAQLLREVERIEDGMTIDTASVANPVLRF